MVGEQPTADEDAISDFAWHVDNCKALQEVGMKKASKVGLYDMQGNITEWCLDSGGYFRPYKKQEDYLGNYDEKRNVRGGCFNSNLNDYLFSTCSGDTWLSNTKREFLGFRLCVGINHRKGNGCLNRIISWF